MKLFQQMLVAGASLSLLAPIAAQASDVVNLEEMNSYVRSTKKQSSRFKESEACAAIGAIKLIAVPATNNCWKSFI